MTDVERTVSSWRDNISTITENEVIKVVLALYTGIKCSRLIFMRENVISLSYLNKEVFTRNFIPASKDPLYVV